MASSKFKDWPLVRIASFMVILIFLTLSFFFIHTARPQLQALTSAKLQMVDATALNKDQAAVSSVGTTGLLDQHVGASTNKPLDAIRLPYLKVLKQSKLPGKLTYTINLDDQVPGLPRIIINAQASKTPKKYGLLFMQTINGGNFYLNGNWLTGLSESSNIEHWMWFKPFTIELPARYFTTDGTPNILTVSQITDEPYIFIPRVYFGAKDELVRNYAVAFFLGNTSAEEVNMIFFVFGLFLLGVWFLLPKERIYICVGSASIFWAVLFIFLRIEHTSADMHELWRWVVYLCEDAMLIVMTVLVLTFVKKPLHRWIRRLLLVLVSVWPMIYYVGGRGTERYLDLFWTPLLMVLYFYAMASLIAYCWRTRNRLSYMLLVQTIFFMFLAIRDYALRAGLIDTFSSAETDAGGDGILFGNIHLLNLAMPLMLIIVAYILLKQHQNNDTLEHSSEHLAAALYQRELVLEKLHEQMKVSATQEAVLAERNRIYQDIHDGIGSQLVKAIFSLRNAGSGFLAVEHNLQSCLQDLRLIVDARPEANIDIQTAVFSFCMTQEVHLEGSGLVISYSVGDETTNYTNPKVSLNILRVLQESLSNTIRHSGASTVQVEITQSDTDLILSIIDNGHRASSQQIAQPQSPYGTSGKKGLAGLALRAADIGGKYMINITEFGTAVLLTVPLPGKAKKISRPASPVDAQ